MSSPATGARRLGAPREGQGVPCHGRSQTARGARRLGGDAAVQLRAVQRHDARYIDWTRDPPPAIFGVEFFETLRRSPKLMARKFDSGVDAEILDLVDSNLLGASEGRS